MAVELNPEPKQPATEGIVLGQKARNQSPEAIERRVNTADYALNEGSPGREALHANFWLQHERQLRETALLDQQVQFRAQKQRLITSVSEDAVFAGRPLTPDERQMIMDITLEEFEANADTVLEHMYSSRFMDDLTTSSGPGNDSETPYEVPEEEARDVEIARNAGEDYLTKTQIAAKIAEEAQLAVDNQHFLETGGQFLLSVVPFVSWSAQTNKINGVHSDSWWLGENVSQQIEGLYFLTPEDFEPALRSAVAEISQFSPLEAAQFAQAAVQYSSSDAAWDNVFTGLDTLDVATLGLAGALGKGARVANRIRSGVHTNAHPNGATAVDRMVAQGDVVSASQTAAIERLNAVLPTGTPEQLVSRPAQQLDDLMQSGMGILDPKAYTRNVGSLSNERAQRILNSMSRNREIIASTLTDVAHLDRINPEATARGAVRAEEDLRRMYPKLEDAIVDVRTVRESEEIYSGVDHISVMIGRKDATPFGKLEQAEFHAKDFYRLTPGSYDIVPEGGSWYIRMTKTIDETDQSLSDIRISTDNVQPVNPLNVFIGTIRNPDTSLSDAHVAARKTATYGANAVIDRLRESARGLAEMSGKERDRLTQVLDQARFKYRTVTDVDGESVQVQGRYYKDIQELEEAYHDTFKVRPTDREIEAYFAFRNIMDWDFIQRNMSVLRDKARMGGEQRSIGVSVQGEDGRYRFRNSEFFEARTIDNLPNDSGSPYTVMWTDAKTGQAKFALSNNFRPGQWDSLQEALEQSDSFIMQPFDARDRVLGNLADSGGEPVQYVVGRSVKSRPLSSHQVSYNEGGHWVYPSSGTYLKQAKSHRTMFGRRMYTGDTTAHFFPATAQGQKFLKAYETARGMLKDVVAGKADGTALELYVNSNLPYRGAREFTNIFRSEKNVDAPFDIDTPFVLTDSGQRTLDVLPADRQWTEAVVDVGRDEHSLSSKINSKYTQERSERLTSIKELGSESQPTYELTGAPLLNPIDTMSRSAADMAKSRFYDDYKHRSIEDWVTSFSDTLDVPLAELRADPVRHLLAEKPKWKEGYSDRPVMSAAQDSRRAITQILSFDNPENKAWKWTMQKAIDKLYEARGQRSLELLEPHLWSGQSDPTALARGAVFHSKLGLLNPAQFVLQGQAVIHAAAITGNPVRAAQGALGYWVMRMRGLSEANTKAQGMFGKAATKALGLSDGVIDDMYDAWKRSGMHIVEGEYARLDDYLNPRQFFDKSGASRGLHAGSVFFREGNNMHRGTSFATAYLEWKKKNPNKKLTNKDLKSVVVRADNMYINMSRASNAAWQTGWASVPTQFFSYHARLSEQLLAGSFGGKGVLTGAEKARVMGVYSAMYGIPIGVAGTSLGVFWPVQESVRQAALEQGIDTDTDKVAQFFMEGAGTMAVQMLAGEEMNFAQRFGPGGMSWLQDILSGEVFDPLGAAPNFLTDFWDSADGIRRVTYGVFSPSAEGFPVTTQDFIDVFRNVSSVSQSVRAWQVFTAGKWITGSASAGNLNVVDDTLPPNDPAMAIAIALGLTPMDVSDAYLMMNSNNAVEDAKRDIERQARAQYQLGLTALRGGNREEAEAFFTRARALIITGDFTPAEQGQIFKRSMRENQTLLEEVSREFVLSDPDNEARRQRYLEENE